MAKSSGLFGPVHIIGIHCTPLLSEQDAMLDELVFDALSGALSECALRKQDVGLSVQASMDVYDARSISSGLTNAAAGGYLNDSYRIEGDAGTAIVAAAEAIAAGDVEVAVAVAVFNPETTGTAGLSHSAFVDRLSSLAFEPIFDRPVGMSAHAVWGMQAVRALDSGAMTEDSLAEMTAESINRGAASARALGRSPVTSEDVLRSPIIAWPLRELMLPAWTTGAAAVVLASPARAARARGRSAVLTGLGHASGDYTWSGEWLHDPGGTTARAAHQAYRLAGLDRPSAQVAVLEHSAATPALETAIIQALDLENLDSARINPTGGVSSGYAGLANGAVRLMDAIEWLDASDGGGPAVVHSTDTVTGAIADDVTVLVVEQA